VIPNAGDRNRERHAASLSRLPRTAASGRSDTVSAHRIAVERVIARMRQHLDAPPSLQGMADLANISPFHFDRVFREITGIPPRAFLSALRLGAAKRLLASTARSVTDICFDLGYSSLGSFVARFGQFVGLSPVEWRRAVAALLSAPRVPARAASKEGGGCAIVAADILAPPEFTGVIFAGLFEQPCPQGRPVACAIVRGSGPVTLRSVPDGLYYLCVAGVPYPLLGADEDQMLRGGGGCNPVLIVEGNIAGDTTVRLREKEPTDPPILFGIPFITAATMRRRTRQARVPQSEAADRPAAGGAA
jgi:AraC-like DNA-binding protein